MDSNKEMEDEEKKKESEEDVDFKGVMTRSMSKQRKSKMFQDKSKNGI